MKYIIANEKKARAAGFNPTLHLTAKGFMVLNGREAEQSPSLGGTLEDRAKALGGRLCGSAAQAKAEINEIMKNRTI